MIRYSEERQPQTPTTTCKKICISFVAVRKSTVQHREGSLVEVMVQVSLLVEVMAQVLLVE